MRQFGRDVFVRLILGPLAALALISGGSVDAARVSRSQDIAARGFGISIAFPRTWDFRFYRRPGDMPVVQAANFRLPPTRVEDDAGTLVDHRMGKRGILLVLEEFPHPGAHYGVHYRAFERPLQLRQRDFFAGVEGVPTNHAFAFVGFMTGGRYFQLRAYFGTRPASRRALSVANRVLGTLRTAA